jgi:3-oxoadipate enol-lactonase
LSGARPREAEEHGRMLLQIRDRRIAYDLLGPDTGPVVCLAHSLSSDSGIWSEQLPPLLAAGWRVLRLNMRGQGGSDAGEGDYTMSGLANDVASVLDALALSQVHFIGVSIGGMIGQTLAIEHAHRLQSMLLCGTAPAALPGGMALWAPRFEAIRQANSVEPLADATMERWFTAAFKARRPDRWQQVRATIASTTPAGYLGGAAAIINFDVLGQLPSVRTPALVVYGDEDTGTPPPGNRLIAERIPGARCVEMSRARHIPMLEYPDQFNHITLDWLQPRR